ncbi:hypothetical protein [Alteromonas sp. a30]|uniref:hypothetical protein n=1 Tax=Alteromonas sp. a30 TaxID=2730917 RepID=UPI0022830906|nr:hypothetical protein [Alteromonas sp. a30]MCY7294469.1 hypothetical protein [Alteromonas sp. a30]
MSKAYWYLCFLLAVILIWYAAKSQISVVDKPLPRILEFEDVCQTKNQSNPHSLILLAPNSFMAKRILQQLCDSAIVGKQFGKVTAYWQTEERDILQLIGKGVVDLILIKENFINAFGSDTTYGYEMIASYADYQAFLMSAREKPILTKEYLLGKRIGILDYPTSRSGYIAPIRLLKDLDLSTQQVKLVYAKSHSELRQLLQSGHVDIISTYWQEEDEKHFSRNYITPLEEQISGSKWYLKMLERNTNLKCEVQKILTQQAENEQFSKYYKNISIIKPCEAE